MDGYAFKKYSSEKEKKIRICVELKFGRFSFFYVLLFCPNISFDTHKSK